MELLYAQKGQIARKTINRVEFLRRWALRLSLQTENVIRADAVIPAKRDQMAQRQLVGAVFVARIDLLRRAQHPRQLRLRLVMVLPQLPDTVHIAFHIDTSAMQPSGVSYFTSHRMY